MVNPSFHLFQLQKIDLRFDAINKRLAEIDRIKNDNSARQMICAELDKKTIELTTHQELLIQIEEKAKTKKLKIEQSESSLYSGTIKNPKELQDLQLEIKSLKSNLSILEDEQLQQMLCLEDCEKNVTTSVDELGKFDMNLSKELAGLFEEEKLIQIESERISHERKAVLDQINPDIIIQYQSLRKLKNGIAVSLIEDGSCSVCGSTLTPSECQTAKSPSQMASCSSCNRILYAG